MVDLQPGDPRTCDAVICNPRSQARNSSFDSSYRRQASSRPMAPLRTAVTTAALRRATQRLVFEGGKSTVVQLVHIKA